MFKKEWTEDDIRQLRTINPRVYLKKDIHTLCLPGQHGISSKEALAYSKLSMNDEMVANYKCFFDND